jgi:hypothetical protein
MYIIYDHLHYNVIKGSMTSITGDKINIELSGDSMLGGWVHITISHIHLSTVSE